MRVVLRREAKDGDSTWSPKVAESDVPATHWRGQLAKLVSEQSKTSIARLAGQADNCPAHLACDISLGHWAHCSHFDNLCLVRDDRQQPVSLSASLLAGNQQNHGHSLLRYWELEISIKANGGVEALRKITPKSEAAVSTNNK